jgi:hypothetical protein
MYNTTSEAATTVFNTTTESVQFKVHYRRAIINILYTINILKIKVNYMKIKESRRFLVQRKCP